MTKAVYPGTFDPVTNGHLDIAIRAAKLFDQLIIGVYDRPAKNLLFPTDERVALWKDAISDISNIKVESYNMLTVEFAKNINAQVIVRGLRMSSDFEGEFEMALMNKQIRPELESIFLMANLKFQFLSSSLLKEVAQLGGSVDKLVPPNVLKALKAKLNVS